MKCLACENKKSERHHVKSRGSGGSDEDWNILHLCRMCHVSIHALGMNRFIKKNDKVKDWLLDNGWIFNEFKKKWTRY